MRPIFSMLLISLVAAQQPAYVVDLVNAERSSDLQYVAVPENERVYPVPPLADSTHGMGSRSAPFELVSLLFDKTSYAFGDEFNCELTMRYLLETPTTFPIGTQMHLFRRSMAGVRAVDIGLLMDQAETGKQTLTTELLYGAPSVTGSLVALSQGQSVRLQLRGVWRLRKESPGASWPLQIAPKVEIGFADENIVYAPTRFTSNVELILSKAQ